MIIAVSTWIDPSGDEKPGFAHSFVVKDASADAIEAIIEETAHSRARS